MVIDHQENVGKKREKRLIIDHQENVVKKREKSKNGKAQERAAGSHLKKNTFEEIKGEG